MDLKDIITRLGDPDKAGANQVWVGKNYSLQEYVRDLKESKLAVIRAAVEAYQARIKTNIMEDGRWRWEYYGVQLRIAQAACSYGGYIVTGTRHYCPIMALQIDLIGEDALVEFAGGYDNVIQGFTDQYGNFLTRQEAYPIAKAAGQIIRYDGEPGTLYSESYI
jgi:hypothetical protein